jgi:WD40 repeat protein
MVYPQNYFNCSTLVFSCCACWLIIKLINLGWIIQLLFDTEDHLISGSEDATIRLWDLVTGDAIHVVHQDCGISCVLASKLKGKQDDLMLFGDRDGKMSYLDLETLHVRLWKILDQ